MIDDGEPGLAGPIRTTLATGVLVAAILFVVGLVLAVAERSDLVGASSASGHIGTLLSGLSSGSPSGFLILGVLVLLATPIVRVVVSIGHFSAARDRAFVGITAFVLVVLALSVGVGLVP